MQDLGISFRDVLESAPDGFLIADAQGVIRLVNGQVEKLFGYSEEELLGRHVEELMPERFREAHFGDRGRYARQPAARPMGLDLDLTGRRSDGSEFPLEISLSPLKTPAGLLISAAIRDVTERRRLQEERNALRIELETEQERERIGMDLHDGIMQAVYAVGLRLELALHDLEAGPDLAKAGVERAIGELQDISRDIRSYIFDLRPRQFSGDLAEAIGDLAREFQQNSQIETNVRVERGIPEIEESRALALYQIVHESLSNIRKHAAASRVVISLGVQDGRLGLSIEDNGRGFDSALEIPEQHRGLRNMAARAQGAGAQLAVAARPGKGTSVAVEMVL